MIGNELEQEIISLYSEDTSSLYSINQVASKLGKKYPYINKKMSSLIKEGIFKKTIIGRSYLCSLNLSSEDTIYLLILGEIRKKKSLIKKTPQLASTLEYISKLSKVTSLSLAIESKGTITFVLEDDKGKEQFEKVIVQEAMKGYKLRVHTKQSFQPELLENEELRKSHAILYGYEKYYEHLRQIEDRLKAKYSKVLP